MQLNDLLQTALESMSRNAMRSALTVLGIVIGIAAVILMLAIGRGAEGFILKEVSDLGSDFIFIEPSSGQEAGGPPNPFVQQTLDLNDVETLKESGLFSVISPVLLSTFPVSRDEESAYAQIAGANEDYLAAFPATIEQGRFIEKADVDSYAKVAVLGSSIAEELFGDQEPVGLRIRIKKTNFRVIGVYGQQGTRFFQNLDKRIVIPVTTAERDLFGVDYVNYIVGRASGDLEVVKQETALLMRESHHLDNPEADPTKDDFAVSSQSDAVQTINVIGAVLTIFLSSIAAISLVVGGIGIMNIMLVSVTERTREIGLRKAIGATAKDISQQFLLEAVLLCSFGGAMGVVFGILLSAAAATVIRHYVGDWDFIVPASAIILGFAVSSAVGVIFGFYPARRAAQLDPIEALRYE